MAGIRPPQRVRIHGGNPNPPIESEVIPQLLRGHVQGGGGWDPKQAMIMTCSPSMPLGSMPIVLETEERLKHVLGESFESQVQVSRDDMRVSITVRGSSKKSITTIVVARREESSTLVRQV